ncbi:MAG: hypothetical protein J7K26_04105 [Candidatus Aenigmarchaeota archaeon]|nr:hypothetical protein [Candidatus Aenigmarchaeota archaeon]
MKFYDMHIQPVEASIDEIINTAIEMKYEGICIVVKPENFERLEKAKNNQKPIKLYTGILIDTDNIDNMKKQINAYREKVDIIIVAGGNYKINRAACENPKVDILAHPEKDRNDNGLDEICLRAAKENNVAIEINFREILYSYRRLRASLIQRISKNIHLCNELKVPMIITSGAKTSWDMRQPRELISVANLLGVELGHAFNMITIIPEEILKTNKMKLENKIISDGVEIV